MNQTTRSAKVPWDYLVITFGFSWLSWLPGVLETQGMLHLPLPTDAFILLGIFGPLVGAIWASVRRSGWAEAGRLLRRALDVRIGALWWLLILVGPFIISALAWLITRQVGGPTGALDSIGNPWMILPMMLFMMVLGGGQEEFGWRGYLLDPLQNRWGALVASEVIGIIWGIWHLPLFFIAGTGQYYLPFWAFLLASPALSILTTWVYTSTGKRLFSAILFHGAINTAMSVFPVIQQTAAGRQTGFLILGGLYWLWAVVMVAQLGNRKLISAR